MTMPARLSCVLFALAVVGAALPARAQTAACVNGSAAGYACLGVDLQSRLPLSTFSSPASPEFPNGTVAPSAGNDVWGWTDPQTGREYALVGLRNGTAFVDVTVATAPVYLGKLPSTGSCQTPPCNSSWRDVKVYQNHAFIVSEAGGHGMQVFDLTRLRGLGGPPQTFTADARYTGNGKAHNLAINEATGFAYLVGANQSGYQCNGGGLHIVDIRNPTSPTFAGCYDGDGYTHDTQCIVYDGPDPGYTGREVCFSSNEDTVTITDVTDKAAPVLIVRGFYSNPVYTHQGWLTEDRRYFVVDDEVDEGRNDPSGSPIAPTTRTITFDVSDLDAPTFTGFYFAPLAVRDHNQYVKGGYTFQSNYEGGLRILELTDLGSGQMVEVAHFDTYPASNTNDYNGQWSNYPYFASGNVIANDINNGLFVLRPQFAIVGAEPGRIGAEAFGLGGPQPNPFTGRTELPLTVSQGQRVRAEAYDALGRRVAVLFDGALAGGAVARLVFDAAGLPPGAYIVRVVGETFTATRRVTLVR